MRPVWPDRDGAILQYTPSRSRVDRVDRVDLGLPYELTAPPTGPTDRASEATIVNDLLYISNQDQSLFTMTISMHEAEVASKPHMLAFHSKHNSMISFIG